MKRRTKKLLVVLAVLGVLAVGAGGAYVARDGVRERRAQAGLRDGTAAFEAREYARAMDGLGRYLSRHPDDADVLLLIARARAQVPLENRRHLASAVMFARRASDLRPTDVPTLELVIDLYAQLGFNTETRQFAQRLIAADPSNIAGHQALVGSLAATNRLDEALAAAEAFVAARPDDVLPYQLLIEVMVLRGDDPRTLLERALAGMERLPDSLAMRILAARAAGAAGNRAEFDRLSQEALALPLSSESELVDLLALLERSDDADARIAELLTRLRDDPRLGPTARDLGAERDWKFGRFLAAQEPLRAAIATPQTASSRAIGLAVVVLTAPADAPGVDAALAELSSRGDPQDRYWKTLAEGVRAVRAEDFRAAREHLAEAVRLDPRPGFAQFFLAELLFPLGEQDEAIRLLENIAGDERAIADPAWRVARSQLVTMKIRAGRLSEARTAANLALGLRPSAPEALAVGYAALTSFDAGSASAADIESLAKALASFDGELAQDPTILGLRAWAAYGLARPAEARPLVQRVVAASAAPASEIALRLLAFTRADDATLHASLLTHLRTVAPADMALVEYEAAFRALTQGPQSARDFIASLARPDDTPQRQAMLQYTLAAAIEPLEPAAAADIHERLVALPDPPLPVVLAIANSDVAWTRRELISRTLSLLREPLGSASTRFRVLDARYQLAFERSEKSASQVVTSLAPIAAANPRDPIAAVLLADAYTILGNRRGGIEALESTLSATGSPLLFPPLIALLQADARGPEADRQLRQFLVYRELPDESRRARSRLAATQGLLKEAVADIDALADRRTADDRLLAAAIRVRLGDLTGAAADVEAARAASPASLPAIFAAAELLAKGGDLDGAVRLIEQSPSAVTPADRRNLVNALLALYADPARAEAALRDATREGGNAESWAQLANFLMKQNRLEEALAAVDQGLKGSPNDSRLSWLRGTIVLATGGESALNDSLSMLSRAAEDPNATPSLRAVLDVMRRVAVEKPDWGRAARDLEEIVEKYPTEVDIRSLLVAAHFNAGAPDRAIAAALLAADAAPGDPRGAKLAAQSLASVGRWEEALTQARAWKTRSADSYEADVFLAGSLLTLGRATEGLDVVLPQRARISGASPPDLPALDVLSRALAGSGKIADARALLEPRLSGDPRVFDLSVSVIRSSIGEPTRAEPLREWLASLDGLATSPPMHMLVAECWVDLGISSNSKDDLARAIAAADKAKGDPATAPFAHLVTATAYDYVDDADRAIEAYDQARTLLPENPIILNNLAYRLTLKRIRAADAVQYATKAVALSANESPAARANFMDTLAQAQLAGGAPKDALATFTTAQSLAPGMPDLFVGLAECHQTLGDAAQAREQLRRLDATLGGRPLSPGLQRRADAVRTALGPG
ncbi:MAG: tetratricopeptide repeat protein [Planctomycetota bacterium]|nr:tetratricopeptide repeat protein [Planctomycetota bacterium]